MEVCILTALADLLSTALLTTPSRPPSLLGESQLDSVDKIMHSTPEFPEKMTELAKSFICQVSLPGRVWGMGRRTVVPGCCNHDKQHSKTHRVFGNFRMTRGGNTHVLLRCAAC